MKKTALSAVLLLAISVGCRSLQTSGHHAAAAQAKAAHAQKTVTDIYHKGSTTPPPMNLHLESLSIDKVFKPNPPMRINIEDVVRQRGDVVSIGDQHYTITKPTRFKVQSKDYFMKIWRDGVLVFKGMTATVEVRTEANGIRTAVLAP